MSQIPHRQLADTDLNVSALGLGTVKFGRNQAVKYPEGFEIPDDKAVLALLSQASDAGINLLDTAPAYGMAEERIGKLVGNSQEWIIGTKVGEYYHDGDSTYRYDADVTRQSIEQSLVRLKRETLDIVMIHSNGDDLRIIEDEPVIETLLSMKQAGIIRAIGISSKTVTGGLKALEYLDVVMCTYNLKETSELPVIQAAHKMDKGIFIKKGLMSGHLKNSDDENPLTSSYQHIFSQPGVTSLVVGTINPSHLKQNINALAAVLKDQ